MSKALTPTRNSTERQIQNAKDKRKELLKQVAKLDKEIAKLESVGEGE